MTHWNNLDSVKGTIKDKVDQQLEHILSQNTSQAPELLRVMHYSALGGGKRVRPMLCFASAQLFDPDYLNNPAVLAVGCAVELIHAYSLVHDDLPAMDDDDLRRGRATAHKAFSEAGAILAGDALQTLAFQVLSQAPGMMPENILASINLLAEASGHNGMAGGQMIDLQAVGHNLSLDAMTNMHRLKTGALIRASVLLGARAVGCIDRTQLEQLASYGREIGLAFQIQDDILDCTSSTEELGKQQGADAEKDKPTYVSLLGLDGAKEQLDQTYQQAIQALHIFNERRQEKSLLEQIADYIVARTH